jgi:colicin import membrane protein
MTRLEKKCFIGSAAFHALAIGGLLLSSLFFVSKQQPGFAASVLTILPPDTKAFGRPDGSPTPAPPKLVEAPKQPEPTPPQPKPEPPKPAPEQPKPEEPQPEPPKPKEVVKAEPKRDPKPKEKDDLVTEKISKKNDKRTATNEVTRIAKAAPSIKQSLVPTVRKNDTAAQERARQLREAQERADREYREQLAAYNAQRTRALATADGVIDGVGQLMSKSGVATPVGVDERGGQVWGRYGDRLKAVYDLKWTLPPDLTEDEPVACVRIIVRRDGSIKSAVITQGSGNATFDRSVRRVLDGIRQVEPFPPDMKDSEREFTWKFERRTRLG